ncbi:Uncharacterised protein [Legionella steigerwaltii]|uniref:Uncharacterized protein n=1 Tax=Legionella steigerwaltii TaxID=460 RepID=A0A378LAY4_9GAMM|nr:hypothetical protein [Legionella steigerwaltii]KTD77772.1 hypothetical protein Lstg_2129 [Legionella steigerwaltii]STY23082.1 Uncharacterised protein [Legionella steigerwaltii]
MSDSKEETNKPISSEKLHNRNCHRYLRELKLPNSLFALNLLPPELVEELTKLQEPSADPDADPDLYFKFKTKYDPSFRYTDLYKKLFDYLEDHIDEIYDGTRYDLSLEAKHISSAQKRIKETEKRIKEQSEPLPLSIFTPAMERLFIKDRGILPWIKKIGEHSHGDAFDEAMSDRVKRLKEEAHALDMFIDSLYANNNRILEKTFKRIKNIPLQQTPSSPSIEHSISHHVSDKEKPINRESTSPAYEGSAIGRFSAMMSDDYKPQHGTSLSTVRRYKYKTDDDPVEYRFGTQGQRDHGEARHSPLFERFLTAQEHIRRYELKRNKKERVEKEPIKEDQVQVDRPNVAQVKDTDDDKITHVYFNLLGRDRGDPEGLKEKALTEKLEELEEHNDNGVIRGKKNIAVITLPADQGLMSKDHYTRTKTKHNIHDVKEEFLRIAQEAPEGRDLHLMDKLPSHEELQKLKGSYIYCNTSDEKNLKNLYYIKSDGALQKVNIKDFSQFEKKLNDLNKEEASSLRLNDKQIETLITAYGGHKPPELTKIKDFHISRRIREKIFCDKNGKYSPETEAEILNDLIEKSFKAVRKPDQQSDRLSDAERQAVYFHFIKYELPNHILTSLKPKSFNFTCKDAIDRGGVASAYYNLIKSFEPSREFSMSREEFEQALHAAPTMVKGRGMNHHIKLLWNAVDAYVTANYEQLKNDESKAWLIEWRDFNCPHARADRLLTQRIKECKDDLAAALADLKARAPADLSGGVSETAETRLIKHGQTILNEIEKQKIKGVSGKRLLLETVVRTTSMALHPKAIEPKAIEKDSDEYKRYKESYEYKRYKELRKDLSIRYPGFLVVAGFMKALAGEVLHFISRGRLDLGKTSGWATFYAGRESSSREFIQKGMSDIKKEFKKHLQNKPQAIEAPQQDQDQHGMDQSDIKKELDGLREKEKYYIPSTDNKVC